MQNKTNARGSALAISLILSMVMTYGSILMVRTFYFFKSTATCSVTHQQRWYAMRSLVAYSTAYIRENSTVLLQKAQEPPIVIWLNGLARALYSEKGYSVSLTITSVSPTRITYEVSLLYKGHVIEKMSDVVRVIIDKSSDTSASHNA